MIPVPIIRERLLAILFHFKFPEIVSPIRTLIVLLFLFAFSYAYIIYANFVCQEVQHIKYTNSFIGYLVYTEQFVKDKQSRVGDLINYNYLII